MLLAPFLWIFCEFDEKVLDNLSLAKQPSRSLFPAVQDWLPLIVQRHVVAYKLCVGLSCKEVKVTERP